MFPTPQGLDIANLFTKQIIYPSKLGFVVKNPHFLHIC